MKNFNTFLKLHVVSPLWYLVNQFNEKIKKNIYVDIVFINFHIMK